MLTLFILGFLFLAIFGVFLCKVIIFRLLKKSDPFAEYLCNTNENFNCDAVLESAFSKFGKNIHLGDIGLFYFSTQFLFLLLSIINDQISVFTILLIPAVAAFITTLILLWYQWRVIKSWCKLCLLLTCIIWMQALLIFYYYFIQYPYLSISYIDDLLSSKSIPSFLTGIICLGIASIWFFIKPIILKANEVTNTRKQIMRWKNNPFLFGAVLKMQKKIETNLWSDDFVLGSEEATIKFMVAMNPYCPACAKEYKLLKNLLRVQHNNICIIIRFGVNLSKPSIGNQAVQHLVHSYHNTTSEKRDDILSDWYHSSNLNVLKSKYTDIDLGNFALLKKYEDWFKEAEIKHTPTLFLNGYEFPPPYRVTDMNILIPILLKNPKLSW